MAWLGFIYEGTRQDRSYVCHECRGHAIVKIATGGIAARGLLEAMGH